MTTSINSLTAPERNKIITFWIWMSIVFCIISLMSCVLELTSGKGIWTRYPDEDIYNYVSIICNGFAVASYVLLLKWNKLGYFLLIACSILIIIFGTTTHKINRSEIQLIVTYLPLLSIVILSLLFFIRTNGKSVWNILLKR